MGNPEEIVEILREMADTLKAISKKLDRLDQLPEISRKLDRFPKETARELEALVYETSFEQEAESEVFTYGLHFGEMPIYPPKALESRVKAWRKAKLMDGRLITDAGKIYVIQAKKHDQDWDQAVQQMDTALQRILADLKKAKLRYRVVPVFAFKEVDHPRRLVRNFKNLKPFPGAEPPLLFPRQGVVVTHEGKRIRLY